MSLTHRLTRAWRRGSETITKTESVVVEAEENLDLDIPDGDDNLVAFALDVSQLKTFFACAAEDLTLETNDGVAPDDVINLKADIPLEWSVGSGQPNPFTVDVAALYVTNATGDAVALEVRAGYDPIV